MPLTTYGTRTTMPSNKLENMQSLYKVFIRRLTLSTKQVCSRTEGKSSYRKKIQILNQVALWQSGGELSVATVFLPQFYL